MIIYLEGSAGRLIQNHLYEGNQFEKDKFEVVNHKITKPFRTVQPFSLNFFRVLCQIDGHLKGEMVC